MTLSLRNPSSTLCAYLSWSACFGSLLYFHSLLSCNLLFRLIFESFLSKFNNCYVKSIIVFLEWTVKKVSRTFHVWKWEIGCWDFLSRKLWLITSYRFYSKELSRVVGIFHFWPAGNLCKPILSWYLAERPVFCLQHYCMPFYITFMFSVL